MRAQVGGRVDKLAVKLSGDEPDNGSYNRLASTARGHASGCVRVLRCAAAGQVREYIEPPVVLGAQASRVFGVPVWSQGVSPLVWLLEEG